MTEMIGPMPFRGDLRHTGPKYDAQVWQAMGEQWVHRHTADHAISLALEIPWNTPASTANGYNKLGWQLGLAIERYFHICPHP